MPTNEPKAAVITGATSGLGFECARELIRRYDYHIVLAARDLGRGEEAARRLRRENSRAAVTLVEMDLESLASVRAAAVKIRTLDIAPIHTLLCNAGLQVVSGSHTGEAGIDQTFLVNHLSHFLLANLLVDRLAPPAKVIFTSSGTHDPALKTGIPEPRFPSADLVAFPDRDPDLPSDTPMRAGQRRYSTSKLCNILCTYEMTRRIQHNALAGKITVNAFDPGLMPGTGLARGYPTMMRFAWFAIMPALTLFVRNVNMPATSGRALARLAASEECADFNGRYFVGRDESKSSEKSYDQAAWLDLWNVSERLSGLTIEDSPLHSLRLAGETGPKVDSKR
jgi:NAD(P)-dependent dehydrogenase (short-subunit alcohol dehydrogenase family)